MNHTILRGFCREEHGGGTAFAMAWLTAGLAMAGLAIDAAVGFTWQARLQSAADAAAHAAAMELPNEVLARQTALDYAAANVDTSTAGQILADADILIGAWDPDARVFVAGAPSPNAVRVTLRRSAANGNAVPTTLLRLIGVDGWDVNTSAVALRNSGLPVEVALVLDTTASMKVTGSWESAKERLIAAVQEIVRLKGDDGDARVAFVPFTDRVNVGVEYASWLGEAPTGGWQGCFRPREIAEPSFPHALTDNPPSVEPFERSQFETEPRWQTGRRPACNSRVLPLTTSLDDIENALNVVTNGGSGRFDEGLAWGWRTVSQNWEGLWGEPGVPRAHGQAQKAVIYIADGYTTANNPPNIWNGFAEHDQLPLSMEGNRMSQGHADHVVEICRKMREQDILLFMIAPSDTYIVMENAMKTCAVDGSLFFQVGDNAGLEAALDEIVSALTSNAQIVQ